MDKIVGGGLVHLGVGGVGGIKIAPGLGWGGTPTIPPSTEPQAPSPTAVLQSGSQ